MGNPRLGSDLTIRNWCMELAELLIPILKQRKVDDDGNSPRYISVKDLTVDHRNLVDVHEFRTTIYYLSDLGDWSEDVIIRYFDSIYNYTLEVTQYERLDSRTKFFGNIEPVELILKDEEDQVLIYLSPQGIELNEFGLSDDLYYFQLGSLMGVLHGGETSKLNLENYRIMSKYLINKIPFDDASKSFIRLKIESEFKLLDNSYAGFEPVSQLDLHHIRFAPLEDNITKINIMNGDAFYIEILPSLLGNIQMDRMEDVSNLFAKKAFEEFTLSGNVKSTRNNIFSLMEGYEGYFEQYSTAPMDRIYPKGLSLDLHMLLGIWLYALSMIQNKQPFDMKTLDKFTKFVLNENPFQIYGL